MSHILKLLFYILRVSSPERAIFKGLTTLRPNIINELLQECESQKVKRLFAFFMEHFNHPWKNFALKGGTTINLFVRDIDDDMEVIDYGL